MSTRREFLRTTAAGFGAAALGAERLFAAARPPIGLQLYSLRNQLKDDVPGTLAKVKAIGFDDVETAGTYGLSVADFAAALRKAGLRARSAHLPFEQFRDDPKGAVRDAKTLGAEFMVCAWIPHQGAFSADAVQSAATVFGGAARTGKAEGVRFAYHLHGYEFVKSPEGTLFDALAARTADAGVLFEVDVLWAKAGGADPAQLIEKLAGRVPLTHLKDMAKGTQYTPPASSLPEETDSVLGTGMLDFPAILKASQKAGVEIHFLEDEHPQSLAHLPESLAYLRKLMA